MVEPIPEDMRANLKPSLPTGDPPAASRGFLPSGMMLSPAEWRRRHRVLVCVLALNALALVPVSLAFDKSLTHSLFEGLLVGVFLPPALVGGSASKWARLIRSVGVALGLLTSSALLVHVTGGLIEAHFHFFVILALVAMYEDWKIFLLYFVYVLVHHGVVGVLLPHEVFNHSAAIDSPWTWALIHATAVVGAAIGSVVCWRFNEDLRHAWNESFVQLRERETQLRSANDELRELDELKSDFVSMASHELRTPMTSITAFSSLMHTYWDEVDDETKRRHTGTIAKQARRLERLVNSLLHISAIESGSLETEPVQLEVQALLDSTVEELACDGIRVDCEEGLTLFADQDQLQQILINFLGNAAKYGAAPIVLAAHKDPADQHQVEISVTDAGAGVPSDFVPRLFERFSQASVGEHRSSKGTGLGLAIAKALAESNNGTVRYTPSLPSGARFSITVPAHAGAVLHARTALVHQGAA